MSEAGSGDIFDLKKLRRLIQLMEENELSELDLEQGDQRVRMRRGPTGAPAVVSSPVAAPAPSDQPTAQPNEEESDFAIIKSPMVGTFYSAASPESPPYVKVGSHVGPDTTVCIVEAMKVFNEIPAEVSGKIVAVLVENGDPVEFGQPLFKVDGSA